MPHKEFSLTDSSSERTADLMKKHGVRMFHVYGDKVIFWFRERTSCSDIDGSEKFPLFEPPLMRKSILLPIIEGELHAFYDFLSEALPLVKQIREAREIMRYEGLEYREEYIAKHGKRGY